MRDLPTRTEYVHASRGRRSTRLVGDDRQRAILATAERLLAERPLADFSVDDLAKGAGISRPTFYFYFPSKNAVLLSLLDQVNTRAHAALTALSGNVSGEPATVWRARIEAFFEMSGSHRAVAVAGAAAKATNPEVRQVWSHFQPVAGFNSVVAKNGYSPNNMADVMTMYWIFCWQVVHGPSDQPSATIRAVDRQLQRSLAASTALVRLRNDQKQQLAEIMAYEAVFGISATQGPAVRSNSAARLKSCGNN